MASLSLSSSLDLFISESSADPDNPSRYHMDFFPYELIFCYCQSPCFLSLWLHRCQLQLRRKEWLLRQRRWLLSSQRRSSWRCSLPYKVVQPLLSDEPLNLISELEAIFNIMIMVTMVEAVFIWTTTVLRFYLHPRRLRWLGSYLHQNLSSRNIQRRVVSITPRK